MLIDDLIIYMERRHTYYMLNAIAEAAKTDTGIGKKLKNLIMETQREAEEDYLLASDKMYEMDALLKEGSFNEWGEENDIFCVSPKETEEGA